MGHGCKTQAQPRSRVLVLASASSASGEQRLWLADRKLVKAVEELGGRVTKADLLARGLPAQGLERELLQLARASGAGLQVNNAGEVLFEFPTNLHQALRRHSLALRVQRAAQVSKSWLQWGGRVLFGVSLISVVIFVCCAVLVVMSTSSSRDENGDNRSSFASHNSFGFRMWFGPNLWDFFYPSPYRYSYYYYERRPKMSFLESIFSFTFGDGDPNKQLLGEKRWEMIGQCITENGGAVTGEQLAPYLDPPTSPTRDLAAQQRQLNSAMLPVLLRFKGRPEVTSEGDLVYVFPELQESRMAGEFIVGDVPTSELKRRLEAVGAPSTAPDRAGVVDDYQLRFQQKSSLLSLLEERQLKFSEADQDQVVMITVLGVLALLGTLYLGTQWPSMSRLSRFSPLIALMTKVYPWILGYTVAFLAIPGVRFLRLGAKNAAIEQRNNWRRQQAQKLRSASDSLRRKLNSAASWAKRQTSFGGAIFDSAETATAREGRRQVDDLEAFDEKLKRSG